MKFTNKTMASVYEASVVFPVASISESRQSIQWAPGYLHWCLRLALPLIGLLSSLPFLSQVRPSPPLKGPGINVPMGQVGDWFIHKLEIRAVQPNCS